MPHHTDQQVAEGHDRREIRQWWVVSEAEYRAYLPRGAAWTTLNSLVKRLTVRITPQKTEMTGRSFISRWMAEGAGVSQAHSGG